MRCKRTGEEVAIKFIERGDKIGMMLITGLLMYPPVRLLVSSSSSGTRRCRGLVVVWDSSSPGLIVPGPLSPGSLPSSPPPVRL